MANIIYCADGTWNHPGLDESASQSSYPTNVFKLFSNLAGAHDAADIRLADEQERFETGPNGEILQRAKYLHGVGDSNNVLVKLLGGIFGAGLIAQIVRGYTFISRNYTPGDQIFLIGFSRGSYTVRALAGLIVAKGLLDRTQLALGDKTLAYRLAVPVWYAYQHALLKQNKVDLLGNFENLIVDFPAFLSQPPTDKLIFPVQISTVAVWDTVGSLGIPEFSNTGGQADLFRFADTKLSTVIAKGVHAVSLDEQRQDFTPTLWDADPRVTQVLFPGAHGDVGGGYTTTNGESGLSDGAFEWMLTQLPTLHFSPVPAFPPAPNALGVAHQPWRQLPWPALPLGLRNFAGKYVSPGPVAISRIKGGPVRSDPVATPETYRPPNLPAL
jgi:uncharacterized protein (DUF2235 family)